MKTEGFHGVKKGPKMDMGLTAVVLMIHQSDLSAEMQFSRIRGLEYRTEKGCRS